MSPVTGALQSYADRGVFRGFRAAPGLRGRTVYEFTWVTKKPMRADYDPRTNTLRFPSLFPGISRAAAADISAIIDARAGRGVPAHKRLDARRARVAGGVRKGDYTLSAVIRATNHDYAVRMLMNVINEMFVALQERHPEYLIEHFGMSAE